MSYQETLQKHLRITLLRLLLDDPRYTMNDSMLKDLTEDYGHTPSRDKTRTELAWLKEQGLITIDGESGVLIVTLTERGKDVAQGRATVPGVKRPSPRS